MARAVAVCAVTAAAPRLPGLHGARRRRQRWQRTPATPGRWRQHRQHCPAIRPDGFDTLADLDTSLPATTEAVPRAGDV